jgi:formamidopyrimidine-DNA glycosylase
MPEGIEIRKFADILINNAIGHNITAINILNGRYKKKVFDGFNELKDNLPLQIKSIQTKGKLTYLELESIRVPNKTFWLINTLGLTGGWTMSARNKSYFKTFKDKGSEPRYIKHSLHGGEPLIFAYPIIWEYISNNNLSEWFERALEHLNVEFILDGSSGSSGSSGSKDDARIYFYDQLSFGTLKLLSDRKLLEKKLQEIGPDIMDDSTTLEIFIKQIRKNVGKKSDSGNDRTRMIGNIIVNQKIISGIGNYLRADVLWMAGVSPFRKVVDTTDTELEYIYKAVRGLMWGDYNYNDAVKKGIIGGPYRNSGKLMIPRDYGREFFIYRQDSDIHGNKVIKKELYEGSQKRFIYYVDMENVQK